MDRGQIIPIRGCRLDRTVTMVKHRVLRLLIFLLLLLPSIFLFADGIEDECILWFDTAPEAAAYGTIQADILDILVEAEASGIPGQLLLSKMKEGAVKGVPPARLVTALKKERDRLLRALDIIEAAGYSPAEDGASTEQSLKMISIILRDNGSSRLLEGVLYEAHRNNRSLSDGTAACGAVFQVGKVTGLSEDQLLSLGTALFDGSLPSSAYNAVVSIFLKARAGRISEEEALDILIEVFGAGKGLIQLEREINRRVQRR